MEIFFLRHGETIWNREKRLQGAIPHIELTEFGVKLAELTRAGFSEKGISFDRVYASDLRRAVQTAQIVTDGTGLSIIQDARLREIDFGPYDGVVVAEASQLDDNLRNCFRDPRKYVPPPGAESYENLHERIRSFIREVLVPLEGICNRVLVVTHSGTMRALIRVVENIPLGPAPAGMRKQTNCCVHRIALENGVFSVLEQSAVYYESME